MSKTVNESANSSRIPSDLETSPLTPGLRNDRKLYRRKSSTEKVIIGLKRAVAAFEYQVVDQPSDEDDDDDDNNFSDKRNQGKRLMRIFYCAVLLVLSSLFVASFALGRISGRGARLATYVSDGDPIMALKADSVIEGLANGAVASDHGLCSNIGNSILIDGGNAVDAAVATTLCLGVANPASSGLGGGAFILIHSDKVNHQRRSKSQESSIQFNDARDPDSPAGSNKITEVIDCREIAPGAATQNMFLDKPTYASSIGGLAVAVPGELRGLELAHVRHGKLSWAEVVKPAIKLARDGVPISQHLAGSIKSIAEVKTKLYGEYPGIRSYLTKNDDWKTYFKEGQVLRNPALADTLQLISEEGSRGFYEGKVAEDIVRDVASDGGILTVEDMANYIPTMRSPVYGVASGFTLVGVPPPSSGGATMIGAARFLAGFENPLASFADTLSIHRTVEALRHAFAIRMSLSDPGFFANKTADAVRDLVTGTYMENLRKMTLDNDTLPLSFYGGRKWAQLNDSDSTGEIADKHEGDRRLRKKNSSDTTARLLARPFGYLEDSGTSHLSVVDKDGNAVAITTSVNQIFGSYVFSKSTGVLLGNTMDDFGNPGRSNFYGLKPSEENFIAAGKKPLSSMSPTMVFRRSERTRETSEFGKLELVVGGSGGPKIITAVLQVFINYCLLGMPIFDSIARPRVHEQLMYHDAPVTTTENSVLDQGPLIGVSKRTKDALLHRGHKLLDIDYAGTVQAISVDLETGTLAAVSDIRKGGKPAGY